MMDYNSLEDVTLQGVVAGVNTHIHCYIQSKSINLYNIGNLLRDGG